MRWHTAGYESPEEAAEREIAIGKIDAWWHAFSASAGMIDAYFAKPDAHPDFDLPEWMHEHLGNIDERLMWEYGPAVNGGKHRLVITPESARQLRPLVGEILQRAPDGGFEFYGARLAETFDDGIATAEARTGSRIVLTGIQCARGPGNRIDVQVTVGSKADEQELDLAWSQAIIFCTTWIGEELADRWLGYIDTIASEKPGPPLGSFKAQFESVKGECLTARQTQPYHTLARESGWSLVRMQPDPEHEITRRSDLFVYRTMDMEFFRTIRNSIPFYSDRFSANAERFCYLMLDGRDAEMEGFEDKSEIEDALDGALIPTRLGAVVGSGTGTRYSYIDLAVTDLDRAIGTIVDVMRNGRIVKDAWILFHDDEWHEEWIGIYADTPRPIRHDWK
jgi:hypothetical protein